MLYTMDMGFDTDAEVKQRQPQQIQSAFPP